jgi:hypothetical protein
MNRQLILATNNKDKIFEISKILEGMDIEILSAGDFDDFPDVEETGKTLVDNARRQERHSSIMPSSRPGRYIKNTVSPAWRTIPGWRWIFWAGRRE